MRERKGFERSNSERNKKKTYFLVFEGEKTEEIYFKTFKEYYPNQLIGIVPLIRSSSESGFSNPQKMLEMILINLKEHKDEKYSYETLIDWIVDYITEEKLIYLKSNRIKTKLNEICKKDIEKNLEKTIQKKDVENIIKSLLQKLREEVKCEFKKISKEMLQEIINSGSIEYYSDLDEIVMIVDRDKSSFTHKQYTELVKECSRHGIKLVVTNPCFEFWLLMHFNINRKFNAKDMLRNDKVTGDITYCHDILRNTFKGYQKNSYDAKLLMYKIKTAIDNEQLYCEDTIGLKTKIGSNVGKLLKELGYSE